jgi:hypothetical protein
MSLARLLAQQRRHDEARSMLAEIYNCFTEGLYRRLMEAKILLDELGAKSRWYTMPTCGEAYEPFSLPVLLNSKLAP